MRLLAVAAALAFMTTACGDDGQPEAAPTTTSGSTTTSTASTSPTSTSSGPPSLEWSDCGQGQQCATLGVPLDYDAPGGEQIEVALRRVPASDPDQRIGSLLVNFGGPGAPGTDYLAGGFEFGGEISERFDLVGFDPRGVGDSTAVTCGDEGLVEEFQALDSDPDTAAEVADLDRAARAIADDCGADHGALLAHVGSDDVVRDIDAIRRALGEDTISFYGFSYGTLLGQRYAEAFPEHSRAIVIDGVVDPSQDLREFLTAQTVAFEQEVGDVFAACDFDPDCPEGGAARAYDDILATIERTPMPAGGDDVLGPADLATATIFVTYDENLRSQFYDALADAVDGDGGALFDLAEGYRSFGNFTSYAAVECVDTPRPEGSVAYRAFAADLEALSPRFGAAIANELLPCAFWPVPPAGQPAPISAPGAPPVLVIGNTGDAATPYEQAVRVADDLESAVLLTLDSAGHTAYGKSSCIDRAVEDYLVDLALPAVGTICAP